MGGAGGTYGESRSAQRVEVIKLEGKRPLYRPRLMAADSVNVDLKQTGWGGSELDYCGSGASGTLL